METVIRAHFLVDQPVEFFVHGQQEILLGFIPGQIIHFGGVVFKVKEFDIIDLENLFKGCRAIVVQRTEISAIFVPAVVKEEN